MTAITAAGDEKILDAGNGAIWIINGWTLRIPSRDELDVKARTIHGQ